MTKAGTVEFIHPPLNEEVRAASGRYEFMKRDVLVHEGREVLYFVGAAMFDSSCCGSGGCGYALVPGYPAGPATERNGQTVSLVEPVTDEEARREIEQELRIREGVTQVRFPTSSD